MRKQICATVLTLVLALSFTGCSDSSVKVVSNSNTINNSITTNAASVVTSSHSNTGSSGAANATGSGTSGGSGITVINTNGVAVVPAAQATYVCNKSTGVYHLKSCYMVNRMNGENKLYTNSSRSVIAAAGYRPCGKCM